MLSLTKHYRYNLNRSVATNKTFVVDKMRLAGLNQSAFGFSFLESICHPNGSKPKGLQSSNMSSKQRVHSYKFQEWLLFIIFISLLAMLDSCVHSLVIVALQSFQEQTYGKFSIMTGKENSNFQISIFALQPQMFEYYVSEYKSKVFCHIQEETFNQFKNS